MEKEIKETYEDRQTRERLLKLSIRWEQQSKLVAQNIQDYAEGFFVKKATMSKNVTEMKDTFRMIEAILKELK